MKLIRVATLVLMLPLSGVFYGCATNSPNPAASAEAGSKVEKKISMAIGQEVGGFSITGQQKTDAPTGFDGIQYTVKTKGGKTFKCDIYESSGFGKVMTLGMSSGGNALCTDFTQGSVEQGTTNKASCNALLKAAGKC